MRVYEAQLAMVLFSVYRYIALCGEEHWGGGWKAVGDVGWKDSLAAATLGLSIH